MRTIKKKIQRKYHFKNLSTTHIFLYPLMVCVWIYNTLSKKLDNSIKWNSKRAESIITNEIINAGEIESDYLIAYSCNTYGYWFRSQRLHHRRFCRKFKEKILDYFINEYEINGYTKEVEVDRDWGCCSFIFRKEEEINDR